MIPTLVREPFHRDGWIYSYGRSPAPLSRDSRWQPRGDAAPFAISQLYRDEDTTIATAVTAAGTLRVRVYDTKQGTVLVPDQALPVRGGVFAAGKIFTGDKATIPFEGTRFICVRSPRIQSLPERSCGSRSSPSRLRGRPPRPVVRPL